MEITNVEASVHTIPTDLPHLGEPLDTTVVFTEVETDEGMSGIGETGYLYTKATADFIEREVASVVTGMDPLETERVWERLHSELNPRSQTGVWSTAVSAVDIALWDIKGKQYKEPIWRLLGGANEEIPVYVTFGVSEYEQEQLVRAAEDFVDEGQERLKMVVGGRDDSTPTRDAERIGLVAEAIGSNVELMIDANYKYSYSEALELCNRIKDYNIGWFEEPVYGNDEDLLADLRMRTSIPIAAGQNEGHRFRHRKLIEGGAVDISHPNVCFVGGYTEGKRVAAMASAYNLEVANGGGWPLQNMHLQAGVGNGTRAEFHYPIWKSAEKIYEDIPEPVDGTVRLPEDPGLGLQPDWDALAEYRTH